MPFVWVLEDDFEKRNPMLNDDSINYIRNYLIRFDLIHELDNFVYDIIVGRRNNYKDFFFNGAERERKLTISVE